MFIDTSAVQKYKQSTAYTVQDPSTHYPFQPVVTKIDTGDNNPTYTCTCAPSSHTPVNSIGVECRHIAAVRRAAHLWTDV